MATHIATTEVRQTAMVEMKQDALVEVKETATPLEPTTDNLDDVSVHSPENEDVPEFRADVEKGVWKPEPSKWVVNDQVMLLLKGGRTAGPFTVVARYEPQKQGDKWRYDIKDAKGNQKNNISESILV